MTTESNRIIIIVSYELEVTPVPRKNETETAPVAEVKAEVMTDPITQVLAEYPAEDPMQIVNGTMNMSENLQTICESFIANRDALRKAVKLGNIKMCVLAADILTTAGVTADVDQLKALRKIINKNNPILFDILPLSLEEVFIYELGGENDEIRKLVF